MRMLTSAVSQAVGGELRGADVPVDGCSIDTRSLTPGQLFVAVVAERDGHEFLGAAAEAGAAACLVSDPSRVPDGLASISVDDTVAALAALGAAARNELPDRVVAITGSVGKTSTKDLARAALASTYRVSASERSFNNELGVPITLFNSPAETEAAVIEMGARGVGHIAELCGVARPQVGVVTRIGVAHTEMFGTIEEVIEAKGELVRALPGSGTAVLEAGQDYARAMEQMTDAEVLTFGIDAGDVRATSVVLDDELHPSFVLDTPWGRADVALAARGLHNVANAAAAGAAAVVLGAGLREVAEGLGRATLSPHRMDLLVAPSGARILNDAYNANPMSVEAALRSLAALPATRRTAVLGVMAELGDRHVAEHRAMAELAAGLGIRVIAVGEPAYGAEVVPDIEGARDALGEIAGGDAVLVKGSRVAGLEALAADLAAS